MCEMGAGTHVDTNDGGHHTKIDTFTDLLFTHTNTLAATLTECRTCSKSLQRGSTNVQHSSCPPYISVCKSIK